MDLCRLEANQGYTERPCLKSISIREVFKNMDEQTGQASSSAAATHTESKPDSTLSSAFLSSSYRNHE